SRLARQARGRPRRRPGRISGEVPRRRSCPPLDQPSSNEPTPRRLGDCSNFSGALCIDEVHDCGRAILVATDPVNDFTVAFLVVPKNNQRNMNRFLDLLKMRGLKVRVAVTDGSRLYKQALFDRWKGLEHQLC